MELSYLDCHIDIQNRSTTQVNLVSGEKNLSCLLNRSDPLLSTDSNEIYEWTKPYTPDHIKKSSCDSDDDRHQNNIPHNIARAQLEDRSYSNKKIQVFMDKGAKDKDFCKPKLLEHFRQTDHRLSWDIECEEIPQRGSNLQVLNTSQPDQSSTISDTPLVQKLKDCSSYEHLSSYPTIAIGGQTRDPFSSPTREMLQLRYHCRLCGQIKHNHVCLMLQSLQRSIGVKVYPALNAFRASEPGKLAPSLSAMNNFVAGPQYACEKTPSRLSISVAMKRKDGEGKLLSQYIHQTLSYMMHPLRSRRILRLNHIVLIVWLDIKQHWEIKKLIHKGVVILRMSMELLITLILCLLRLI